MYCQAAQSFMEKMCSLVGRTSLASSKDMVASSRLPDLSKFRLFNTIRLCWDSAKHSGDRQMHAAWQNAGLHNILSCACKQCRAGVLIKMSSGMQESCQHGMMRILGLAGCKKLHMVRLHLRVSSSIFSAGGLPSNTYLQCTYQAARLQLASLEWQQQWHANTPDKKLQ